MAQCPNCHKSIEILDKHLGTLFTCPSCNAVFFVDWDGQPEMANHEVEVEVEPHIEGSFVPPADVPKAPAYETSIEPTVVGSISEVIPEEMTPQEEPYLEPAEEIQPGSEFQTPESYSHENQFGQSQDMNSDFSGASMDEAPLGDFNSEENLPDITPEQTPEPVPEPEIDEYDFNKALGEAPPQPMQRLGSDNANFADITDFANANTSTAGPLSYVVVIDGIESSHLLKQLREAMTDSRFGWDVTALLSQMAGGRLILSGLSPAKASVLINRIKYLPFKISWRQDVLSSS